MSREGRAAYSRRTNKAAQRQFGHTKPKLPPKGTELDWVPEFLETMQGLKCISVNSVVALPLGDTAAYREAKLRAASRAGFLHMYALRENGQFVEFRWELSTSLPGK